MEKIQDELLEEKLLKDKEKINNLEKNLFFNENKIAELDFGK